MDPAPSPERQARPVTAWDLAAGLALVITMLAVQWFLAARDAAPLVRSIGGIAAGFAAYGIVQAIGRRVRGKRAEARPRALTLKNGLSWIGLAAVITWDYWFPPIFHAVPMALWMLLLIVGTVYGVRRWIAFFMNSPSKP